MRSNNVKIGQVVYILSKKNQQIIPAIVHEENVCKRIDGEFITYKVMMGENKNAKLIDLAKIDSDIFSDLEEVRQHLLSSFTKIVDEACENAANMSQKWYGHLLNQQTVAAPTDPSSALLDEIASQMSNTTNNTVMVELPDGRMVPAT